MKKFISMVMAAAMVVSLVPATAFAANEATMKVVNDVDMTKDEAKNGKAISGPEVQIKLTDVDAAENTTGEEFEFKLHFDNVEKTKGYNGGEVGSVMRTIDSKEKQAVGTVSLEAYDADDDVLKFTIKESDKYNFKDGDVIVIELNNWYFSKTSAGTQATVKMTGDFGTTDEKVFATIVDKAIDVEIDDTVDVAEEEVATLEELTIEPSVGKTFSVVAEKGDTLTLKLSKGFEFDKTATAVIDFNTDGVADYTIPASAYDDNEIEIKVGDRILGSGELTITGLVVEATTAKAGDVCTLTVDLEDCDSVKVEVATVVDYKVVMSVDEDEDVPVFYNGVDSKNTGLTVDDDHKSLEVTIEETFAGAWSMHKDFTLSLPEGVHVVAVEADDVNGTLEDEIALDAKGGAFWNAYQEGDHESFVFEKRTFEETNPDDKDKCHEMEVVLTLVADPDFVGDVVLTLEGDAVDTQEVTIAKFVAPYTVKAEQNDLKIDYRYTEVGTDIVITEAEAGLWEEKMDITLGVEGGHITFEDDAVITVNEESDMEIDDKTDTKAGTIKLTVKEESDEEPAVVTISDIQLYMERNIPAGPYDLEVVSGKWFTNFEKEMLFAPDCDSTKVANCCTRETDSYECATDDHECYVADVADYSETVKEAWINVVTAGREQDDASFTTKVVVPVGESYIVAGETQIALDVPAYVNAAGYTMLPVRAVAVALGINTQNVLWDQATKTVTILYGQRIITMQVGAKVVYVNGSAIPASASVEIVDGRTFLPMRDLATALGVTDITWDAATKTATLNGNA